MASATDKSADVALYQHVQRVRTQLSSAGHGTKAQIVARAAAELAVDAATVYRLLKRYAGTPHSAAEPQRKQRQDAGACAVGELELQRISAALLASYRRNGNRILSVDAAVQMLRDNGEISTGLTAGRLTALLMDKGLHPAQLTRPTPAQEQRSLHPNHVWQVDASVCVAYYLSNATGLQVMDEKKFYKNKPNNLTRIQEERLIRYALADHFTHEVLTRYYLGSECAAHLADFLIWCFAPKDGHPMHGVPFILQMDMGSANTSAPVLNMLQRLNVHVIIHERHNSRANGSVEKAHHLVELGFESGLRFQHVDGLDDMNAKAQEWANHFAATKEHTRYGKTRHALWLTIGVDELRLAPPVDWMRTLPTSRPQERRVSNNLTIDFAVRGHGSFDYDLRYLPGVMAGSKVQVVVNGLKPPAIEVQYADAESGEMMWLTVQPTARDEAGYRLDAPIIGEQLRAAPRGLVDRNRDKVMQIAFGGNTPKEAAAAQEKGALAFGGRVDPFKTAREAKLPAFMHKRGTPLDVPGRQVSAPLVSCVAMAKRIRDAMVRQGRGDLFGPHVMAWLQTKWGDAGVPDDAFERLLAQFMTPVEAPASAGLRVVGGWQ